MAEGEIEVVWQRDTGGGDVCVLADGSTSRVTPAALELVAGLPFWIYRADLAAGATPDAAAALLRATWETLEAGFTAPAGGPRGLCVLSGPDELRADAAARWADPPMLHAGFLPDGRQARIGYFAGAEIGG